MSSGSPGDLIVLTADKDAKVVMEELMRRHADLGIRPIDVDIYPHPQHDNGVLKRSHDFLRFLLKWRYALVVFDHEGSGREDKARTVLEEEVENRLAANEWENRSKAIVIDPELEAWVWDGSCQVSRFLDWPGGPRELQPWLKREGFAGPGDPKPRRPKEALQDAMFQRRISRSSSHFREMARDFRFRGCVDPAFVKFRSTMHTWFPLP